MRRVAGAVVLGTALAASALTAPANAAAAPQVTAFGVVGRGPHDLVWISATGLTPRAAAGVRLVGDDGSAVDLAPVVADRSGAVTNPDGYRTPDDLAVGTYRAVVTDRTGASATSGPVDIVAPSLQLRAPNNPGDPAFVGLEGIGGGSEVARTVTLDGAPVPFSSSEDRRGTSGSMGVTLQVPLALTPGTHVVRFTQDRFPAVSLDATFSLAAPNLTVTGWHGEPTGLLGGRSDVYISGGRFGEPADVALQVTDAAHHTFALPDLHSGFPVDRLPGLATGPATFLGTNRRNGVTARADVVIASPTVSAPSGLAAGSSLMSPNGSTQLRVGSDGNLVVFREGVPRWSSVTAGRAGARLAFQSDGSLALVTPGPRPAVVWSNRRPTADRPTRLVAQDDGNVVVYSSRGVAVWSTRTVGYDPRDLPNGSVLGPGGRLRDGNGSYDAVMQTDGNLVIYDRETSVALWSTRTSHQPGAWATLQDDGNFVVYSAAGKALWANRVFPGSGARLELAVDGTLVEYARHGNAVWSTRTAR